MRVGTPILSMILAATLVGAGCASVPMLEQTAAAPCEAVPLELVIKGGPVQNTSPEGQSMAVDVRVFALAKRDAFDRFDHDKAQKGEETLGPDLLANTRITVFPDDEQIVAMSVPPKTRYVAMVGLFRKSDGDGWSKVVDVQPLVSRCQPGGLAGLIRAQVVDNRIQADATAQ